MLYLKNISTDDGNDIYLMLQEIAANDNGFINYAYGISYDEFVVWLKKEVSVDNGNLEDWMVPQSSYWMYDGDVPVGYGRLRHYLNDNLRETGGHIGYAIASSKRGKGYGTAILSLLKLKSTELGITQLQVGANVDNELSNRVIKRNGGVLIRTNNNKNFYHINLV